MGILFSKKTNYCNETSFKEKSILTSDQYIKNRILRCDQYIKNQPWIFDLEEKIQNHDIISFEIDYNIENHIKDIFWKLSYFQDPFLVFDVPYQINVIESKYPIDLIVGLYSIYHEPLTVQLYLSDIFVGEYILKPLTIIRLNRFLFRFTFYGVDDSIKINSNKKLLEIKSNISLISCILDNNVRNVINYLF